MAASLFLLVAGLAIVMGGAHLLVEGASALSRRLGVAPLAIGLTVVAFGTSAPEVVVNAIAASRGETGLAFGNFVGACLVNIGVVLGVTALVRPPTVEPSLLSRELPMLLLAVAAFVVLAADPWLDGAPRAVLGRGDGLVLLLLFGVFLYYTVGSVRTARASDALLREVRRAELPGAGFGLGGAIAGTLLGLLGLSIGGHTTVSAATALAEALGVPAVIIGVTLVSVGTTLPELLTCVLAARKGHDDIALGNVVGSNLFNLLAIGGLVAAIEPVPVPPGGMLDLAVLALAALLVPLMGRRRRRITRGEGIVLLALYAVWLGTRLVTASAP